MRRLAAATSLLFVFASCNCGDTLKNAGADIQVTPLSIDFGGVASGTVVTRVVTVSSTGTHALTLTRVAIENDSRAAFSVGLPPTMLAPGSRAELVVTYVAPTAEGADGTSLVIESDAQSNPEVRVSLSARSLNGCIECGDSGVDGGGDSGIADSGTDGGTDAGEDGGTDAGSDAGTDAGDDGGTDAGSDAGIDAGTDAGQPIPDGGVVILDFDTLPNDSFITPGYGGLTWDSDWYTYYTIVPDYQAHSGNQFITNDFQASPISFSFPAPVFFEGAWFSLDATRNAHVWFDLYDASGTHLGTSATLTQQLTPMFLPVNLGNVSKVSVNFDVDFAMDDVTYIP